MTPYDRPVDAILSDARERGNRMLGGTPVPVGLDNLTIYAGLIGSALELAKLIQTEERDLTVIHSHHQLAVAQMGAAFEEIEKALSADFQRDDKALDGNLRFIEMLIDKGQFELASEFHKRMTDGFARSYLEILVERRNDLARGTGSSLHFR